MGSPIGHEHELPALAALSLRQLGRAYGFDRVFLGKLVARGELPAVRRGRALKVLRSDFEAWFRREAWRRTRSAEALVESRLEHEARRRQRESSP